MYIKGFCSRLMLSCSVPSAWGRYKESHSDDAFLDEVSGCHYLLNTLYNAIHRLHKFGTPTSCHHCCFKLQTPKEHHGMNMESSKCYVYMWWWCTGCLPSSYIWEYNIKMGNPKSSHKTASRHMGQYMHKEYEPESGSSWEGRSPSQWAHEPQQVHYMLHSTFLSPGVCAVDFANSDSLHQNGWLHQTAS